jgi:hypothetical protein
MGKCIRHRRKTECERKKMRCCSSYIHFYEFVVSHQVQNRPGITFLFLCLDDDKKNNSSTSCGPRPDQARPHHIPMMAPFPLIIPYRPNKQVATRVGIDRSVPDSLGEKKKCLKTPRGIACLG